MGMIYFCLGCFLFLSFDALTEDPLRQVLILLASLFLGFGGLFLASLNYLRLIKIRIQRFLSQKL